MDLNYVIKLVERDLPNWNWLIRSNDGSGYFVHLTAPDFKGFIGPENEDKSTGTHYPLYGESPAAALFSCYNEAMAQKASSSTG